ncbi:hypothetical protein DID80_07605 [Candidatus Marinamargulisbacteria bacterium SCGC AAA071-K20]|nr:hypothetical protein DID80_07605 [Candidatus Marinamargulisbacteria bacterium SCGC AAA071-K20]
MGKNIHMLMTGCLGKIFSEKKVQVLKFFYTYPHGQFTGRDIARQLHLNHKTCLLILNQFCDIGLLNKEVIGKAHVFYMQPSFYWTNIINIMIEKEKNIVTFLSEDITNHFSMDTEKIILFGSYSTKKETEASDIDICFIVKSKSQVFEDKLSNFEDQFYKTYLCHLSPYVITEKDYINEDIDIIKEIKKEGRELWSTQKK